MYSYTFWSSSSGANYRSDLPIDASHVGIQKETTPPKKPVDSLSTSSLLQRQYVPSSNHVSAFPILCPFFSLPSPSYLEHGLTRTRNGSDHPHSALSTRLGGGTNNRSMLRRSTERTSSPVESTRAARHTRAGHATQMSSSCARVAMASLCGERRFVAKTFLKEWG